MTPARSRYESWFMMSPVPSLLTGRLWSRTLEVGPGPVPHPRHDLGLLLRPVGILRRHPQQLLGATELHAFAVLVLGGDAVAPVGGDPGGDHVGPAGGDAELPADRGVTVAPAPPVQHLIA